MKKPIILTSLISTVFTLSILVLFGFKSNEASPPQVVTDEIGSIVVWPGMQSEIPDGWILCDGRDISKNKYNELYEKLSTLWSTDVGTGADFFRVPDLRGVFIRGVNSTRNDKYRDEALNYRERLSNSSSFGVNDPGSFQNDAFQQHNHGGGKHKHQTGKHSHALDVWDGNNVPSGKASAAYIGTKQRGTTSTKRSSVTVYESDKIIDDQGSVETRSKNAYVHFIIYSGVTN